LVFSERRYKRLLLDRELVENIASLSCWTLIYCPDQEFKEMIEIHNELYLHDFAYLLQEAVNKKRSEMFFGQY